MAMVVRLHKESAMPNETVIAILLVALPFVLLAAVVASVDFYSNRRS
jgi:hypothetical protein